MASRAARRRLYAATGTLRSVQGGAAVVPGTAAVVYWHVTRAACQAGMSRQGLHRALRRHGLLPDKFR
ncbi:MAG: hypothetical protein RIT02_2925 [Planctomycetota bacterium]|jgi:transcriptional regulator of acetoin/glycerol metabolism